MQHKKLSKSKMRELAVRAYRGQGDVFRLIGRYDDAVSSYQNALKLAKNRAERIAVLIDTTTAHTKNGNFNEAFKLLKKGEALLEKEGMKNSPAYGNILIKMGSVRKEEGKVGEARVYFEQGVELLLACRDKENVESDLGRAFYALGSAYFAQGHFKKAMELMEKSKTIRKKLDNLQGVAKCLNVIGACSIYLEEKEKALWHFLESVKLVEKIGDKQDLAIGYHNIALVYHLLNSLDEALKYYKKSLQVGDNVWVASAYSGMGCVYEDMGDWKKAEEYYKRSLKVVKEKNLGSWIPTVYKCLGNIYCKKGDFKKGLWYLTELLSFAKKNNIPRERMFSLQLMGDAYMRKGDVGEAERAYTESLKIAEEISNEDILSNIFRGLGETSLFRGEIENALEYAHKALVAAQKQEESDIGETYCLFGKIYSKKGELKKAQGYFEKALGVFEKLGRPYNEAKAHMELGKFLLKYYGRGVEHLKKAEHTFRKLGAAKELENVEYIESQFC